MITEISDIHLRQNLSTLLNQVEDRKDSILISKDGKPVAAHIDGDLFTRINRIRDRFDDLANRIAEDYTEAPVGSTQA